MSTSQGRICNVVIKLSQDHPLENINLLGAMGNPCQVQSKMQNSQSQIIDLSEHTSAQRGHQRGNLPGIVTFGIDLRKGLSLKRKPSRLSGSLS